MIIIAGFSRTERDKRDVAVEAFAAMVGRARKQKGCLDFSITSDSVDPERINIFECWLDQQSLDAWRKKATKGPRVVLRDSQVKLYRSDKAEDPMARSPRATSP